MKAVAHDMTTSPDIDRQVAEILGWRPYTEHGNWCKRPIDDTHAQVRTSYPAYSTARELQGEMISWLRDKAGNVHLDITSTDCFLRTHHDAGYLFLGYDTPLTISLALCKAIIAVGGEG